MRLNDNGLTLVRENVPVSVFSLSQIEIKCGGHNGRRIVITDTESGATLITSDLSFLDALEKSGAVPSVADKVKDVRKELGALPHRERRAWAIFFTTIVLTGVALYTSVDFLVGVAVKQIPPAWEKQIGDVVLSNYRQKHTLIESGPEVNRLRTIVNRLAAQLHENPYTFHVYVEQTDNVNAMAIPGGNVIVLSGLLSGTKSNDEIAGVLGHEIGHVVKRHSLRAGLHEAGLLGCFTIIFQGQGRDQAAWLANLINLDSMQFGRAQEDEADLIGVQLASKADYDPHALVAFFERMQKEGGNASKILDSKVFEILSTHPCTPERIAKIKQEIARLEKSKPSASEPSQKEKISEPGRKGKTSKRSLKGKNSKSSPKGKTSEPKAPKGGVPPT